MHPATLFPLPVLCSGPDTLAEPGRGTPFLSGQARWSVRAAVRTRAPCPSPVRPPLRTGAQLPPPAAILTLITLH